MKAKCYACDERIDHHNRCRKRACRAQLEKKQFYNIYPAHVFQTVMLNHDYTRTSTDEFTIMPYNWCLDTTAVTEHFIKDTILKG